MTRLVGILACLMFTTSLADAFQIAPECKTMKDPIGCTCAVQNGGRVTMRPGGGVRWYSKPEGRAPTNEAFVRCNIRVRGRG
jgi:hypothetical protein